MAQIDTQTKNKINTMLRAMMCGFKMVVPSSRNHLMFSNGVQKIFIPRGECRKDLDIANIQQLCTALQADAAPVLKIYNEYDTTKAQGMLNSIIYERLGSARVIADTPAKQAEVQEKAAINARLGSPVPAYVTSFMTDVDIEYLKATTREIALNIKNMSDYECAGLDIDAINSLLDSLLKMSENYDIYLADIRTKAEETHDKN